MDVIVVGYDYYWQNRRVESRFNSNATVFICRVMLSICVRGSLVQGDDEDAHRSSEYGYAPIGKFKHHWLESL